MLTFWPLTFKARPQGRKSTWSVKLPQSSNKKIILPAQSTLSFPFHRLGALQPQAPSVCQALCQARTDMTQNHRLGPQAFETHQHTFHRHFLCARLNRWPVPPLLTLGPSTDAQEPSRPLTASPAQTSRSRAAGHLRPLRDQQCSRMEPVCSPVSAPADART